MTELADRLHAVSERLRDLNAAPPAELVDEVYDLSQQLEYETSLRWKPIADAEHERAEVNAERYMALATVLQYLIPGLWHFGAPGVPHLESHCTDECWSKVITPAGMTVQMPRGAYWTLTPANRPIRLLGAQEPSAPPER